MQIPLNIDWQQILLHLFNFTILAGGLYLLLYRPVKNFIKKREEHYQSLDQAAQKDREEARQMAEDYKARLSEVDKEIAEKKRQAQKEMDQLRQQELEQTRQQADTLLAQARAATQQEHDAMVAKASKELTEMVVNAAERIALKSQGDPYGQFLDLVEGEENHGQDKQG